jgi:uncharacterized DUF497 family protein
MQYFAWNEEKNEQLKIERGISFDDIRVAIAEGKVLGVLPHPNQKQYPGQKMYIVEVNKYAYVVPFVADAEKIFLKTIYPSRNATKKYIKE